MPVSSARSQMASSKHSTATKTHGTLRNKNLKPRTKAWKNMSFYMRRHWQCHQRDILSMAIGSKSGSPLAKDSPSNPSGSNSSREGVKDMPYIIKLYAPHHYSTRDVIFSMPNWLDCSLCGNSDLFQVVSSQVKRIGRLGAHWRNPLLQRH